MSFPHSQPPYLPASIEQATHLKQVNIFLIQTWFLGIFCVVIKFLFDVLETLCKCYMILHL